MLKFTKTKGKTKFIITLLLLLSLLVITNIVFAAGDIYDSANFTKKGDIIYFQKPSDWSGNTPKVYFWNVLDNTSSFDPYPGVEMTLVQDNLYKYEFTTDSAFTNLLFVDGADNNLKTNDLDFICSQYIYKDDLMSTETKKYLTVGDTIYFEKTDAWDETIYIYLWNDANSNAAWHTTKMQKISDNTYSYTLTENDNVTLNGFDKVIFSDSTNQTKDLLIIEKNLLFKINDAAESTGKYDGFWFYSIDKTSLSNLINETVVPADDGIYYTEDSYKLYKEQFDLANVLMNTKYVSATFSTYTSQYEKSLKGLRFAYDNLKLNAKILQNKIDEMGNVDTSKYEQSLVDDFNNSISNAKKDLNDINNLTIAKIKDNISKMTVAYNNLKVDKSDLSDLIDMANGIDKDLYTDDTIKHLSDALVEAQKVYDDEDASHSNVQEQMKILSAAIDNLELKEETNTEVNKPTEPTEKPTEEPTEQPADSTELTDSTLENTNKFNPATGDMIFKVIGILLLAIIVFAITFVYSKKYNK